MIEESKYCSYMMKKHFNKELVMAKKGEEGFDNSTKCWIYDNAYFDGDSELRFVVISLENIEVLHIEVLISMLN